MFNISIYIAMSWFADKKICKNMDSICKNMQKGAKICTKICKICRRPYFQVEYLHIYALPTLLMLVNRHGLPHPPASHLGFRRGNGSVPRSDRVPDNSLLELQVEFCMIIGCRAVNLNGRLVTQQDSGDLTPSRIQVRVTVTVTRRPRF